MAETRRSNTYARTFEATCPNNGAVIRYRLLVSTAETVMVERIVAATDAIGSGFHEDIADALHAEFGGIQTLVAHHHGVDITTVRS